MFKAIDGPAEVRLKGDSIDSAQITLNGLGVVGPNDFSGNGELVVAVELRQENTIEVKIAGDPGATLEVRVTQLTGADLGVLRQGYFG